MALLGREMGTLGLFCGCTSYIAGAGAGLCVLRGATTTNVFASQVECVAEKQEPGLIFKMQIKPFPSGLAGFSAVWLQIIDSQSR